MVKNMGDETIKYDHSQETLGRALGISDERIQTIFNTATRLILENNSYSRCLEKTTNDFSKEKSLLFAFYLGHSKERSEILSQLIATNDKDELITMMVGWEAVSRIIALGGVGLMEQISKNFGELERLRQEIEAKLGEGSVSSSFSIKKVRDGDSQTTV
jgi:hypothetical protein